MLIVQYAESSSSGFLTEEIGWIDLGPSLRLSNFTPDGYVENIIPGVGKISFDISIEVTGNQVIADNVIYQGVEVPTFSAAPFANVDYTGIDGYIALYTTANSAINNVLNITFVLSNIKVTDSSGNSLDFIFIAADAETTNKGDTSESELWGVTTNSGTWQLVQLIPSVSGISDAGPEVTGVGTASVLETGLATSSSTTSANVFSTYNPTEVTAIARVDGGRQGFAFGVIAFPDNDSCISGKSTCISNAIVLIPGQTRCFEPCSNDSFYGTVFVNGTEYTITDEVTYITGSIATYVVTNRRILVIPNETISQYHYDFVVTLESNGRCMDQNLLVFKGITPIC